MSEFYNRGNNPQPVEGKNKKRPSQATRPTVQKKRNGTCPVPNGTLLIGDSMIRMVNPDEVRFQSSDSSCVP